MPSHARVHSIIPALAAGSCRSDGVDYDAGVPRKPDSSPGKRIVNKKARFEYHLFDKIEAGIVLKGSEVKSLRSGLASLTDAFARIDRQEIVLVGAQIEPYPQSPITSHDPKRVRKLLLHKREVRRLTAKLDAKGFTLVPLCIYFNQHGKAKVELALARGKTLFDKRQALRAREDRQEISRIRRSSDR